MTAGNPAAPSGGPSQIEKGLGFAIAAIVLLVMVAGLVVFMAGEDLFGSDPGTIDSYPFTIVVALSTAVDGLDGAPIAVTDGLPAADNDPFWAGAGADVTDVTETPAGTHSFVRLRLAQREVDGRL